MKLKFIIVILLAFSCKSKKSSDNSTVYHPDFSPGPPTMVYKMKGDYSNLVPVVLSDDDSSIVSYPHPMDLSSDSIFLLPSALEKGYWLDNKGIGSKVAFLKWTYDEYSKFDSVPDMSILIANIAYKDPLTELCDCGNKNSFKDVKSQLNELILRDSLRTVCKVIR